MARYPINDPAFDEAFEKEQALRREYFPKTVAFLEAYRDDPYWGKITGMPHSLARGDDIEQMEREEAGDRYDEYEAKVDEIWDEYFAARYTQ